MNDLRLVPWHERESLDYESILEIAQMTEGLRAKDLYVMDGGNDPFYVGAPRQIRDAAWFRDVWEGLGHGDDSRVHLRRLHYQLISQDEKIQLPYLVTWAKKTQSTDVYLNVAACWEFLKKASKYARYLGLIPVGSIIDRRNPEVKAFDESGRPRARFMVEMDEVASDDFELHHGMLAWIDEVPEFPSYTTEQVFGDRVYHVELWAEKSTMDDILIPLCQDHEINLVTGLGELSVKACWDLVERNTTNARPTRIFYISDFDPSGRNMPVSVGVKVQWMINHVADRRDVKLIPLLLTHEQVDEYELPGEPIKKTDKGRARFVESFGDRATELDALEAIHPGELESLIENAIEQYTAASLESWRDERWIEYEDYLRTVADQELAELSVRRAAVVARRAEIVEEMESELSVIRSRRDKIIEKYIEKYEDEIKSMAEEIELINYEAFEILESALGDDDNLPGIEDAIENELIPEHDGFLFDSGRTYFEQLGIFKVHQKKPMKLNLVEGVEQ